MQLNAGRIGVGKRTSRPKGYSISSPSAPAPTNVPGTYGGPPGSFITRSSCPAGYNPVQLSRGDIRCVPIPRAITSPPPQPAANITVSPTFQQDFTPQFSPVIQQQQDSPGAAQSASPEQIATTSQTAIPESTPSIIAAPIPAPISDVYSLPSTLPTPSKIPESITAPAQETQIFTPSKKENYLPIVLIAGAIALVYGIKK